MAHVITFRSTRFDIRAEPPNPINPIGGKGVLDWLRKKLRENGWETTDPEAEDWGWYMDATLGDAAYLVGASGEAEADASEVHWTIQIHNRRSVLQRMTGKNKMSAADPLSARVESILRADGGAVGLEVEKEALGTG